MARRYFVDELPPAGEALLGGEVAHHLANVLRVQPGDALVLADGNGAQCRAVVERCGAGKVALQVAGSECVPRPGAQLHVAFAPPRWTRADWLFEHGTEVGIDAFWPLWTERSRPQGGRADRWQKIVERLLRLAGIDAQGPTVRAPREVRDTLAHFGIVARPGNVRLPPLPPLWR